MTTNDILIVHFNTPELTTALVKSINKFSPGCDITIFDNSNKNPFPETEGVRIIDNTQGQLIDFKSILDSYPEKLNTSNDYGSAKHTLSIDYMFDILTDGFVLMDSDILLKKDIRSFFNPEVIFSGHINKSKPNKPKPRLCPYICWINVPLCKKYGIRYFDGDRTWRLHPGDEQYDTGASFLEDCLKTGQPTEEIDIKKYIVHFGRASWKNYDWEYWLKYYQILYES